MQVAIGRPERSTPNEVSVAPEVPPSIVIVTSGLPADTAEGEIEEIDGAGAGVDAT